MNVSKIHLHFQRKVAWKLIKYAQMYCMTYAHTLTAHLINLVLPKNDIENYGIQPETNLFLTQQLFSKLKRIAI